MPGPSRSLSFFRAKQFLLWEPMSPGSAVGVSMHDLWSELAKSRNQSRIRDLNTILLNPARQGIPSTGILNRRDQRIGYTREQLFDNVLNEKVNFIAMSFAKPIYVISSLNSSADQENAWVRSKY